MEGNRMISGDIVGGGDGKLSELTEGSESDKNPLMNKEILTNIFGYLDVGDLGKARQVCKIWCLASQAVWRSSATLKFYPGGPKQTYVSESGWGLGPWWDTSRTTIGDFINSQKKSEQALEQSEPFRRFQFIGRVRDYYSDPPPIALLNTLEVTALWRLVGEHVTALTLTQCSFAKIDEVRMVMYQACPNLQSLRMEDCKILDSNYNMDRPKGSYYLYKTNEEDDDREYKEPTFGENIHLTSLRLQYCLPDSWLNILSHFPKLNCLTLYGAAPHLNDPAGDPYRFWNQNPLYGCKLLKAIGIIKTMDERKLPLKHFRVDAGFQLTQGRESLETLQVFQKLELPLTDLAIHLYDNMNLGDIRRILEQHAPTLTRISCTRFSSRPCVQFPFGIEFQTLRELRIAGRFSESLTFLKYMPNLENLTLYGRERTGFFNAIRAEGSGSHYLFSNTSRIEMAEVRLLKLKTLFMDFQISEDNLKRLVKWTPNVENLVMLLSDEIFAIVCEHWSHLTYLTDKGIKLTDVGVTGLNSGIDMVGEGDIRQRPNVTWLKSLKRFGTNSQLLTGKAVFHGFLKMHCLESVSLSHKMNKFKDEAANRALREKGIRMYKIYGGSELPARPGIRTQVGHVFHSATQYLRWGMELLTPLRSGIEQTAQSSSDSSCRDPEDTACDIEGPELV